MSGEDKLQALRAVEGSGLPAKAALKQLGIPRSTYYRWRFRFRRQGRVGLQDRPSRRERNWNELAQEVRDRLEVERPPGRHEPSTILRIREPPQLIEQIRDVNNPGLGGRIGRAGRARRRGWIVGLLHEFSQIDIALAVEAKGSPC